MTYVAVLVSWRFAQDRAGWYYAWIFVLQFAVTGAFLSFDVILFYVFFELTLIPAFFLIGGWGVGGGKRDAARKFFLYTLFGSLFSLIGLIGIVYTNPSPPGRWMNSAKPAQLPRGSVTFNINELMMNVGKWSWEYDRAVSEATTKNEEAAVTAERTKTPKDVDRQAQAEREMVQAISTRQAYHSAQFWLFFCLIAGFVVKIPLVPFHTWLPSAYCEAPPAVTLLLSAVMAKLGTLGLMRIVIPLCPEMSVQYGLPVLGTLAAIGIVYAAACAFAQKDVKRMAAYSSISHLGLLVLGLFALNQEGMTGAALHMLNHGLTAGAMFALLAFLHDRFQTTDTTQYGGLLAQYPRFAFFMMVICLAAVGLPGLNNFVSEMMLISALFTPWNTTISGYGLAVAAAAGIFLSAWYTFTMVRVVFFGPTRTPPVPKDETAPDLTGREMVAYGLPALLCLVLGILPQVMIDTVKADIAVLHSHVTQARMRLHPKLLQEENQLPAWSTVNEDTRSLRLDGPPPGGPGNLPLPEGNPPRPPGP
jgi:NADH-quinone oxidoreductase subunit M